MKHNKSIIAIALFTLLSLANASAAGIDDSITNLPVELKFIGNIKTQPLFQLNFSGSKEENEFHISITDEAGYTFYSAIVKGEKFSKQFLLNTDDFGDIVLKFEITGKKSGKTAVYKVKQQTLISEQMNIVKL